MKHIELFNNGFDSTVQEKIQPENWPYIGRDMVTGEIVYTLVPEPVIGPGDNEIWYTSSDGNIVTPCATNVFGANIVSNTYENGKGVITFDGPVTSIGWSAFSDCSSLTSVTIPNSVTSIGGNAFSSCSSLTSVTIPESVTSIGNNAFYYCQSLTHITIPNSVMNIGNQAFINCPSLTSITIPNSVTSIGYGVFSDCSGLTSITIPNSVSSIGNYTFIRCTSLTSVTILESVTSIGNKTFYNCSSLTTITCEATTPPTLGSDNTLSNVTAVYVPADSVDAYKTATNWSYYANVIQSI